MNGRDLRALGWVSAAAAAPFLPLVLRPWVMPGNFGDLYLYHYPLRHLVASRLQSGQMPLWNPYLFGGVPLAANPQALLLYPFAQLHYFLPLAWAFSLDAAAHVLLAAAGAFLLARRGGLERAGASLAALAYALSPFLIYRVAQGVPTHLAALAWAPWVWLAALGRHPLPLAITLALQVLSGHPQFALIDAAGLGLWVLLAAPRRAPALAAAGLLGVALAAAQALPTLEYLRHSVRAVWTSAYSLGYSLRPAYLATLVWPEWFGDPRRADFALPPSEFFEMLALYLGLVPLGLALWAGWRGRRRAAAATAALGAAGLFLALGANNPLYARLQPLLRLDFLRVPARFSFLILWALWLAAGRGWKAAAFSPRLRAALALLAALDVGARACRWVYAQDPARFLAPQPRIAAFLRGATRVATAPELFFANKMMLYRIPNATGYEAFYPAPIAAYTARSERGPAADGSRTYIRRWDSPEMAALGVRYYLSARALPAAAPVFRGPGLFVYENRSASPLVEGADAWTEREPERIDARVSRPGALLLRQAYYPGWTAAAAGEPLELAVADGLFPAVPTPRDAPPPWTVRVRFAPRSWRAGLAATIVSLLLVAGLLEARLRSWTS